jgi:hypothetical protein
MSLSGSFSILSLIAWSGIAFYPPVMGEMEDIRDANPVFGIELVRLRQNRENCPQED